MTEKTNKQLLEEIHRGIYGDKVNHQPGLLDRQAKDEEVSADHEERLKKLERFNGLVMWVVGAFGTLFTVIGGILSVIIPWRDIWDLIFQVKR